MTSGVIGPTSLGLETNISTHSSSPSAVDSKPSVLLLDGDTSTEGSISPDLLISNEAPALNANAPAFTSASSMTPVLITKNIEIGNERWKPTATIVEENINTIHHLPDLPQPYIAPDGLYYWSADMMNGFHQPQPVLIENLPNGTAVVAAEHNHVYTQQQPPTTTDMVSHPPQPPPLLISATGSDLSMDELKKSIQNQFEYYFSRENLATDQYLNSQMDGDQYVSISTVAKFNQVRKLTSDIGLIVEALRESPYVQIDETEQKVRANIKRCIVILREIPESTPIEDVKALFASPNCPKWTSFEYAYNDNWYVTFDCEDDAKDAYRYLREEVQSFQGRPLMARIKAKTLLSRTVYLPKNASSATSTASDTSPPVESVTSQFTTIQQPVPAYTVSHPQIFSQQQHNFPFYTTTVNGNPGILPGTWFSTRFIQPEIRPKNNYNKYNNYQGNKQMNGQRPYFSGPKPRIFRNNNYNNNKVPFHERNGNVEQDDRTPSSATNRRPNHSSHVNNAPNNSNIANSNYRSRDDPRFVRHSGPKKDYRSNTEEGPRFQRLRERRGKDDPAVPSSKHEKTSTSTASESIQVNTSQMNEDLDLALENFPALPSPNSPNESGSSSANRSASSLKELAANALSDAETKTLPPSPTLPATATSDLMATDIPVEVSDSEISAPSNEVPPSSNAHPSNKTATAQQQQQQSSVPKTLSYAQMAQKPNSGNKENLLLEDDASDISDASGSIESKKAPVIKQDSGKPTNPQQQNGKSAVRKNAPNSKSSPKSQHRLNDSKAASSNEKIELNEQASSVTSPVLKESYASKFGSLSSDTKTSAPSRPKGPQTNTNIAKGAPVAKSNTLPAPRPLMSQVINLPANKMDEVNGLQQTPQPISFSDTVKKTTVEPSSVPTSPKSVDGSQSSVPLPPPVLTKAASLPAQQQTTIENETEKTNS